MGHEGGHGKHDDSKQTQDGEQAGAGELGLDCLCDGAQQPRHGDGFSERKPAHGEHDDCPGVIVEVFGEQHARGVECHHGGHGDHAHVPNKVFKERGAAPQDDGDQRHHKHITNMSSRAHVQTGKETPNHLSQLGSGSMLWSATTFCGLAMGLAMPATLDASAIPITRACANCEPSGSVLSTGCTTEYMSTGAATLDTNADRTVDTHMMDSST
ncbi:hypothetical protein OGAPHI_004019 [Ogataea philodendri]|uniref:Uncharacterized protein n=1 Tax=Ogataea philodendri TaxID=1378263 RepID=A0A9P8P684_9ASCO|nr:uncharacterized protein OGAPHI_004019 [Ogataea philodendri]KAH3665831.1 hypothetical protein OGAPHI_004019 [Ogataea philodendri]